MWEVIFYSHVKKHLHDRITALRGKVLAHKASLTPPRSIDVPVPSQ